MATPFDYAETLADAQELIEEFGRDVAIVKKGSTATDDKAPWEGGTAGPATDDATVKAVFTALGSTFKEDNRVRVTDQLCLIAAGTITPQTGDKLDGAEVVAVQEIKPGDTSILFFVAVRS